MDCKQAGLLLPITNRRRQRAEFHTDKKLMLIVQFFATSYIDHGQMKLFA